MGNILKKKSLINVLRRILPGLQLPLDYSKKLTNKWTAKSTEKQEKIQSQIKILRLFPRPQRIFLPDHLLTCDNPV